mgnify:CR=1 FL=1
MKKFIRQLTIFSLIFIMTFGVGFSSQKGINVQAATTQTTTTNDGKLRKNGVLFTGISDNKYYKRGVFTKYTGWKNWKGNRYYLKKGKAVTGWKYLRDYSGSRTKYKYYFKKNGRLSKDLFKTFGSSYKKKRMKLELNLVTHNITFLLYDGKTNMTFQPKLLYVLPQETAAVLMLETTIFPKELPAPGSFTKKATLGITTSGEYS